MEERRPPFPAWDDASAEWWERWSRRHGRVVGAESGRPRWSVRLDRGKKAEGVVYLVHGAGGRPEQWRGVLEALAEALPRHTLVATTLYGHARSGRSGAEADFGTAEMEADVRGELEGLAGGGVPLTVVGHSFGSCLAARVSDLATGGVVLLGGAAEAPAAARSPLLACCYCFLQVVRPLLGRLSAAMLYGPAADADAVARERQVTAQNPWPTVCGLAAGLDWPAPERVRPRRALVLHGAHDRLTPLAGAAELARRAGARLVTLERCGHNLMMEEPARVATEIAAFARRRA